MLIRLLSHAIKTHVIEFCSLYFPHEKAVELGECFRAHLDRIDREKQLFPLFAQLKRMYYCLYEECLQQTLVNDVAQLQPPIHELLLEHCSNLTVCEQVTQFAIEQFIEMVAHQTDVVNHATHVIYYRNREIECTTVVLKIFQKIISLREEALQISLPDLVAFRSIFFNYFKEHSKALNFSPAVQAISGDFQCLEACKEDWLKISWEEFYNIHKQVTNYIKFEFKKMPKLVYEPMPAPATIPHEIQHHYTALRKARVLHAAVNDALETFLHAWPGYHDYKDWFDAWHIQVLLAHRQLMQWLVAPSIQSMVETTHGISFERTVEDDVTLEALSEYAFLLRKFLKYMITVHATEEILLACPQPFFLWQAHGVSEELATCQRVALQLRHLVRLFKDIDGFLKALERVQADESCALTVSYYYEPHTAHFRTVEAWWPKVLQFVAHVQSPPTYEWCFEALAALADRLRGRPAVLALLLEPSLEAWPSAPIDAEAESCEMSVLLLQKTLQSLDTTLRGLLLQYVDRGVLDVEKCRRYMLPIQQLLICFSQHLEYAERYLALRTRAIERQQWQAERGMLQPLLAGVLQKTPFHSVKQVLRDNRVAIFNVLLPKLNLATLQQLQGTEEYRQSLLKGRLDERVEELAAADSVATVCKR